MIVYEPNRNWIKDIFHLTTSWTMKKLLIAVIVVSALSGGIIFILCDILDAHPMLNSGIFSLFGIVLSILLVFRTNTAYDRWWEGRKQWGSLVNNSRNMAIMIQAMLPVEDKKNRDYFARHISNFSLALAEHLRKGTVLEKLDLTEDELAMCKEMEHVPNYISSLLFKRAQELYRSGIFTNDDILNLKPQLQALLDVLGACERIKKTPIPFSYAVFLKTIISAYIILLPFGLVNDYGYYSIPIVSFVAFAFMGIQMMAEEIEDPFELNCNDLPTETIAHTIRRNVYELMCNNHTIEVKHETHLYDKIF